jgi:acyl-CoA thioester hydrolase
MPRINLEERPAYAFKMDLSVRVTDLNYGAHLANNALVEILHEARVHLLHQLDCTEHNLGDGQTGIIMGDLVVNFKQEGFLFDKLTVKSHLDEISKRSFRIFYKVCKNDTVLALAETGIIAFSYQQRRPAPLPQAFLDALSAYLQTQSAEAAQLNQQAQKN